MQIMSTILILKDNTVLNSANDYVSSSNFSRLELEQITFNSRELGILSLNTRMIYYLHFSGTQMAPIVVWVPLSGVFYKMMA